jgi:alpha-glucosidase
MKTWLLNRYVLVLLAVLNVITIAAIVFLVVTWPKTALVALSHTVLQSGPRPLIQYTWGEAYLLVEVLDDDLVHFELSAYGPTTKTAIYTSPMVYKTDYPGPSHFSDDGQGALETADIKLQVKPDRCIALTDKTRQLPLTTLCPLDPGLSIAANQTQNVYGLGEQFMKPGETDGDWLGQVRAPGNNEGNAMLPFNRGMVGNAQFPIMYAVGQDNKNYALFLDHVYKQQWDFTRNPWRVNTPGDVLRFYVLTGPDLPDLRQDYVELTGHPPVPPKKMFGLWISEYGYDDWAELEDKLATLRANHFPVDGFVLDLQWYGGIAPESGNTRMGSLTWDEKAFPNPAEKIAQLKAQGVGLMAIEQSYIGRWRPEHADMEKQGYLARDCIDCQATLLTSNPWWGIGGMIDWTNDAGSDYWHDWKRQPLIQAGLIGHWTDLGEPEVYNAQAWYHGIEPGQHSDADVHNIYNLKWSESIYRGYARNEVTQRPFILSRSGTAGSQRFGVAMWSGDIGSNLGSLAAHMNVQMQMSLAGMDYFGADIGGFYRNGLDGDLGQMYTRWLANGLAFDVPARAHTQNLCNCNETAPDRVGDVASNLDNVRQRYALSPYLYSLAHRAYLYGEPVMPPLVYYYQSDPNVRKLGGEKLWGRDVLIASVTAYGEAQRAVYLPAGKWVNYHTNEWLTSSGQTFQAPTVIDGKFKLPMFMRAGAIIPQMHVDEQTLNILGQRSDGRPRNELVVSVYADTAPSQFTLYEDDGETIAYQRGQVRTTPISQLQTGYGVTMTIGSAAGDYTGAISSRNNLVKLIVNNTQAGSVTCNGVSLTRHATLTAFDAAASGWYSTFHNLVLIKTGEMPVAAEKRFAVTLAAGE